MSEEMSPNPTAGGVDAFCLGSVAFAEEGLAPCPTFEIAGAAFEEGFVGGGAAGAAADFPPFPELFVVFLTFFHGGTGRID